MQGSIDLKIGRELFRITEHRRAVTFVGFVHQGEFFVTSSAHEGKAIVWETHSGKQIRTIEFKRQSGFQGFGLVKEASSADGTRMAVLSGSELSVLNIEKGTVASWVISMSHRYMITDIACISDSDMLVLGGFKPGARITAKQGVLIRCRHDGQGDFVIGETGGVVTALAVGNNAFVLSGHCGFEEKFGEEGNLCLWNCKSRLRPIQTFNDDGITITALGFSGHGLHAISGNNRGSIKVWDILG